MRPKMRPKSQLFVRVTNERAVVFLVQENLFDAFLAVGNMCCCRIG